MAKICLNVFEQWFTLLRNTHNFPDLTKISQKFYFTIINLHKISNQFFRLIQGIKQPVRPFYPLCKVRYPGGKIARQGGPGGGCRGKLGGGPGLI